MPGPGDDVVESEADKVKRLEALVGSLSQTVKDMEEAQKKNEDKKSFEYAAIRMPAPRLEEGMSIDEYEASIQTWQEVGGVPLERQGAVLLHGLPLRGDKAGGLQKMVLNRTKDKLNTKEGAAEVLKAVKAIMCKPTYYRLLDWLEEIFRARQKSGWIMQKWINLHEDRIRKAKDEFGMDIPPMLDAALLIRGVTSIEPGILAALLKDQDLSNASAGVDLVQNIKDILVKNHVPVAALGAAAASVKYVEEDAYGQPIKRRKMSSEGDMEGEFAQCEDEEVFFTRGNKRKGIPLQKAGGQAGATSKGYPVRFGNGRATDQKKDFENEKARCMELNLCFKCKSPDHRLQDCPQKRRELEAKRRAVLKRGENWDRRDGTVECPDGTIIQKQKYVSGQYYVQDGPENEVEIPRGLVKLGLDMENKDVLVFPELTESTPRTDGYYTDKKFEGQEILNEDLLDGADVDETLTVEKAGEMLDNPVLYADEVSVQRILISSDNSKTEAVMDTGCSRCCAGADWSKSYLSSLNEFDKQS